MTVLYMKQARPSQKEIDQLWKLYHAADRIDTRYHGSRLREISDELRNTDLSRMDRLFILRSWDICIESGTFNRLFGAYDTWVYNAQDPALDYCEYKPELQEQIEAGGLATVYEEAYQEASEELAARKDDTLGQELLDVMRKYGWNIDRKNGVAVLEMIMHRLKAFDVVGQSMSRYMLDPEAFLIDSVMMRQTEPHSAEEEDDDA